MVGRAGVSSVLLSCHGCGDCFVGGWQLWDEWTIPCLLPSPCGSCHAKGWFAGMSGHSLRCQALCGQLCWWLAVLGCMDDPNCTAILCSGCHALLCLPWWGLAGHGWIGLLCAVIPSGSCHAGAWQDRDDWGLSTMVWASSRLLVCNLKRSKYRHVHNKELPKEHKWIIIQII